MKTETILLTIESIAFGGSGIARAKDGLVYFVPHTIPGEVVKAKVLKIKKTYRECKLLEIITPAAERINPQCPMAGKSCPGCAYQQMNYDCEINIKQRQLVDFMKTVPGFLAECNLLPPVKSETELYYRNKLTLHTAPEQNETGLGYVMADNYNIIDIPQCPLATTAINAKLKDLREKPEFFHTLHHKMKVTLRDAGPAGVYFWRNSPPAKMSWLKEKTEYGIISVPVGSFFQVNNSGRDALLRIIFDWLVQKPPQIFIDLYCGCGIFSVVAARAGVPEILCLDSDGPGIKAAEYNLQAINSNHRLFAGTSEKLLPDLLKGIETSDAVLTVDPPRTGLDYTTIKSIISGSIPEIFYISCSPDTMVRDIQHFTASGYQIISTQLVDMFPRTSHFETIVRLRRG